MEEFNGTPVLAFDTVADWEAWLDRHHDLPGGVWLKIARKGTGGATVTNDEIHDVALCYGWIPGQRRGHDANHFLQKYVRRRPKSLWSRVNVDRVEELIAEGRMRPPGFAEIEAAKADGRWDAAYESQRNATVPPDLEAALAADERARARFEALNRTGRYAVILPLLTAKTPRTRAARLAKAVAQLAAPAQEGR